MSKESIEDFDIFIKESIYPDADGIFSFKPKSLLEIKENCIVVLDTNTLLLPYTTGKDSLKQIKQIYSNLVLKKALVVPAQVAREFADNRVNKLKELNQQVSRAKAKLSLGKYPLLEELEEYKKTHQLGIEINEKLTEYNKSITDLLKVISEWYWNDPVSCIYNDIFSLGVVKNLNYDKESITQRLEKDIKYKLPPGYKDAGKKDSGIGDLLIWETILAIGQEKKCHVIFVSLDKKSDWWSQSEGAPLYPRFELIDEFRRVSDGKTCHIISFSKFLDLFDATDDVVEEIRKEESQALLSALPKHSIKQRQILDVEQAVFSQIFQLYGSRLGSSPTDMGVDGFVTKENGRVAGIEVKFIYDNKKSRLIVKNTMERLKRVYERALEKGFFNEIWLILICENKSLVSDVEEYVNDCSHLLRECTINIGYLDEGGGLILF